MPQPCDGEAQHTRHTSTRARVRLQLRVLAMEARVKHCANQGVVLICGHFATARVCSVCMNSSSESQKRQ